LRGRIEFVRKAATGVEVLRAQQWLNRSEELLALLEIVPFDAAAAKLFDGLRTAPGLGNVGRADLLIASIALAQRATVVTRNLRDFQAIPRLSVQNWME
jgi:tRNA(fMet)-specific endonuclease VapC